MRACLLTVAAAWTGGGDSIAQLAVDSRGQLAATLRLAPGESGAAMGSLVEWVSNTTTAAALTVQKPFRAEASAVAWTRLWMCAAVIFGQIAIAGALAIALKLRGDSERKGYEGRRKQPAPPPAAVPELLGAMAAWIGFGMLLTVFNKWLFLPSGGNFPHVVALSAWHQLCVVLATQALRVSPWGEAIMPAAARHGCLAGLNLSTAAAAVLPPAVCFAGSLALGNSAIFFLSVSFAQMLRAAKPPLVFLASYLVGLEEWSTTRAWLILAVFLGAAACSMGEVQFNAVGFVYQGLTFLTDVARLLTLKVLVSQPSLDPYSAMSIFAPICFLSFLGPVYLLEWSNISLVQLTELRWHLLANGLLAVGLNAATLRLMHLAPPTVFALTGTMNYLCTAAISIWFFATPTGATQLGSFAFTLVAVSAYNYHQQTGGLPFSQLFDKKRLNAE